MHTLAWPLIFLKLFDVGSSAIETGGRRGVRQILRIVVCAMLWWVGGGETRGGALSLSHEEGKRRYMATGTR